MPTDFTFNRDFHRRDSILRIDVDWATANSGGIAAFKGLDHEQLKVLFAEHFIDPDAAQNNSPTAQQFYDFMVRNRSVRAHGYAVSPTRDDYRMMIEGLMAPENDVTPQLVTEFREFCSGADELITDGDLWSWWD